MDHYEARFNEISSRRAHNTLSAVETKAWESAWDNMLDSEREGVDRYTAAWYYLWYSTYSMVIEEN